MKFTLMTINLRYGTADDGEHAWENRRPVMTEMLRGYHPDIFGVQEGLRFQLDELIESLPGYACFGEGRDGLGMGEHAAVFYDVHRLYCLEVHSFWLSETPETPGSRSWESGHSRIVTWGRFQVKSTGVPFYFYNTHFDNRSELARQRSAELVWRRVHSRPGIAFFTGDFNCNEESFAWRYLTGKLDGAGDFTDAWHAAEERKNPVSTYHGYRGPQDANIRIDWVLMRPPLRVLKAETVIYQKKGFYASDHFPVYVEVDMPDEPSDNGLTRTMG